MSIKRLAIASITLLALSLLLIPVSYTPIKIEKNIDAIINIDSNISGYLEQITGLEGGVKYVETIDLYVNLSCYRGTTMKIYYGRVGEAIYISPGTTIKIPVNDTNNYLYVEGVPRCSMRLWGYIEYQVYRYLWVSALSFILGLSGGIILLRIVITDLSRRLNQH
ncbi:MAG: hypothetical protein QXE01_04170 [Sulfolobales archaeon]